MRINYRLTETKCIRLSKEPTYMETDNPITISIDVAPIFRKQKLSATVFVNDLSREIPVIFEADGQGKVHLPKVEYPQEITFIVRGQQLWTGEPVKVKSLNELTKEFMEAMPEYAALPTKVKTLEERIKSLEDKHQIIL